MAKRPIKKKISKISTLLDVPAKAKETPDKVEEPVKKVKHTTIDYNKIADAYKKEMQSKTGRPKKEVSANRVKLTTKLNSELIKFLKITAVQKDITTADFIEELIIEYIRTNKPDYTFDSEITERIKNK